MVCRHAPGHTAKMKEFKKYAEEGDSTPDDIGTSFDDDYWIKGTWQIDLTAHHGADTTFNHSWYFQWDNDVDETDPAQTTVVPKGTTTTISDESTPKDCGDPTTYSYGIVVVTVVSGTTMLINRIHYWNRWDIVAKDDEDIVAGPS